MASIRTQILVVALAALLPTVAALAMLTDRVGHLDGATRAVAQTYKAIQGCNRLVTLFSDMRLSLRAYAISGDSMFLDTYQGARARWPETLLAAARAVENDPPQLQRLVNVDRGTDEFFTDWEQRLESMRPNGDDAQAWMRIGIDERQMQRISATIAELVQVEEEQISARLHYVEHARRQVYLGALATSLAAIGLLAALTALLGRSIARPIQRVAEAAHRVGDGDWNERVRPQGGRETRILADAFNRMTDALQRARSALAERNRELEQSGVRLATANEGLAERQRETDDFLYVLSHDLRAPLINIQGFGKRLHTSMLALETCLPDSTKVQESAKLLSRMAQSLGFVNLGTAKIDQLISRLLDIARLTTRQQQHQWVDLETMVHDVLGACRFQLEERGIEASVGTLPRIFADPVQLNQVFTNLIDNAIKYMGERPVKRISVTATVESERYRLAVQDTGPGIEPKDQEKVFRMFSRLAPSATTGEGIGLAAVRAIVNRHGGRIWVESTYGVGSTFYFTLLRTGENDPARAEMPAPIDRMVAMSREETTHAH